MALFRFEASDSYGEPVAGTLDAADLDTARAQLIQRGWSELALVPVVVPRSEPSTPTWATAPIPEPKPEPESKPRRLANRPTLPDLLEQIQTLIRAGVPLPSGLRASAGELDSAPLRRTCERLADRIEAGDGLETALLAESGRFPGQVRGLIGAGVQTGTLALVLARVVRSANLGVELRRRVLVTIAYPSLITVALVGLVLFVCRVMHTINSGTAGFDQIVGSTQDLTRAANFGRTMVVVTDWVGVRDAAIGLSLVGLTLGSFALWRLVLGPVRRGRIVRSLPAVGPMIRAAHLAEFCHLAAILIDAALPLPEALALAGASVEDPALGASTAEVAGRVAAGASLPEALRVWRDLPAALGQILAWGSEQPDLAGALRFAGEMFEARAEAQSKLAAQILAGVLLLAIFWLVCFAVAAIFLPLQYILTMAGFLILL